jgi:hypothetical protein
VSGGKLRAAILRVITTVRSGLMTQHPETIPAASHQTVERIMGRLRLAWLLEAT